MTAELLTGTVTEWNAAGNKIKEVELVANPETILLGVVAIRCWLVLESKPFLGLS